MTLHELAQTHAHLRYLATQAGLTSQEDQPQRSNQQSLQLPAQIACTARLISLLEDDVLSPADGVNLLASIKSLSSPTPEIIAALQLESLSLLGDLPAVLATPSQFCQDTSIPAHHWSARFILVDIVIRIERCALEHIPWCPRIGRLDTLLTPRYLRGAHSRRTLLSFNAGELGEMIEVVGCVDSAESVGVYIPGTGSNLDDSHVNTEVAENLVQDSSATIAVIVFLHGRFPQHMALEAPYSRYARQIAPQLARFSLHLRERLRPGVPLCFIGHSYGGVILSHGEVEGLQADRCLYMQTPKIAAGLTQRADPHRPRYTMTCPGDPIVLSQYAHWIASGCSHTRGQLGDGFLELLSGRYADGTLIEGTSGHGGVFTRYSDSYHQMQKFIEAPDALVHLDSRRSLLSHLQYIPQWLTAFTLSTSLR